MEKVPQIFLSYSHADNKLADYLSANLTNSGISTFSDINQIEPGDDWAEKIMNSIQKSSHFVPIITEGYLHSRWAMQELGAAIASGLKIAPIVIGKIDLPFSISKYQCIQIDKDNKEDKDEAIKKIIEAIK